MSANSIPNPPVITINQPEGIYWQPNIYLVTTSEIDGRRRWQTIILLLAEKVGDKEISETLLPRIAPNSMASQN